jgi:Zn-dependent protease with chaperone function
VSRRRAFDLHQAGRLRGFYFDGRTSAASRVEIRIEGGEIIVKGDGVERAWPFAGVRIAPRLGNAARTIDFPDGTACEVLDHTAVDHLPALGSRLHRGLHLLASRVHYLAAAAAVTAFLAWASIDYGIPWLAYHVADTLPRDVDRALGEGALEGMDQFIFERSQVDRSTRPRLRGKFAELAQAAKLEDQPRLEFRASPDFGANAFALPSGIVVLTDELVASARSDEELLAVLAHELGHIQHRHALRGVLQTSIIPVLLAAITGDPASVSALGATMPAILISMRYSQRFELEADDFAVELLDRQGIPRYHLSDILRRISRADPGGHYLSSHPATYERVERIHRR